MLGGMEPEFLTTKPFPEEEAPARGKPLGAYHKVGEIRAGHPPCAPSLPL